MILKGGTYKEKPDLLTQVLRLFLFLSLQKASFLRSINKKSRVCLRPTWLFFVAEGGFEPPTFGL